MVRRTHAALFGRMSECAPQHDRKPPVELGACFLRQCLQLTRRGERLRDPADADRERGMHARHRDVTAPDTRRAAGRTTGGLAAAY